MSRVQATEKQNLPFAGEISRIQTKKAIFNGYIVSHSNTCNHVATSFLSEFLNHGKFVSLIEQKRFTDCLEYLEKLGYTSDTAILVLANLQKVGGVA